MSADAEIHCPECKGEIHGGESLFALNNVWHSSCFRCSECKTVLSNCYYAKDTVLFCREHYLKKYGDRCHRCEKVISGPVMVAGDHKYDPECFSCKNCGKFIVDNEDYVLLERHELLCGECYNGRIASCKRQRASTFHTIRHMRIPKDQRKRISLAIDQETLTAANKNELVKDQKAIKRKSLAIKDVDSPEETDCPLIPGDKVLEVNGVLVNDENIKKVSEMLCVENEAVQVTVERQQDTNFNKPKESGHNLDIKSCPYEQNSSCVIVDQDDQPRRPFVPRNRSLSSFASSMIPRVSVFKKGFSERTNSQEFVDGHDANGYRPRSESKGSPAPRRARSASLPRCGLVTDEATIIKTCSLIHRAQSFKVKNVTEENKIFRPADLVLGDVIGKGFFGQVMKVTHRETGEVMVMKELINFDEDAQTSFLKEVALLKSLNHPNVLKFLGVVWKGRTLNLITALVSGGSLRQVIKNKNFTLPWTQRVQFAKDISAGMAYLHSMNVIHRDLNSKNCLVEQGDDDEDMTVVVADFGLARIVKEERPFSPSIFSSNPFSSPPGSPISPRPPPPRKRYTVVGTPYWMAPEMLNGQEYDEHVDIFSFGIVLCEIIGRVKADPDFLPRTKKFGVDEGKFISTFCSDCPTVFYQIAFLCCSMDPRERPNFATLEGWFEGLVAHLALNICLPTDLQQALSKYSSKER